MAVAAVLTLSSCNENYSNGERIGMVTQFSKTGNFYKSWEGHLNVTQTGMNSSVPFDFSIDNDTEPTGVVKTIDSAAQYGWKVKLIYHEVMGKNWLNNRGDTDHFVTKAEVLDRNPMAHNFGQEIPGSGSTAPRKIPDTIYVVIDRSHEIKKANNVYIGPK